MSNCIYLSYFFHLIYNIININLHILFYFYSQGGIQYGGSILGSP